MKRIYEKVLDHHFASFRQMAFVSGPRQAGKSTVCTSFKKPSLYLNWDNQTHRNLILSGPEKVAEALGLHKLGVTKPLLVFDEIHKYGKWKNFLKGLFDTYEHQIQIVVTGSSRLDVFQKGGDSLMGRYFLYRLHPLSVGELVRPGSRKKEILPPMRLSEFSWKKLIRFGGFPEPFLKGKSDFWQKWKILRKSQFFKEDLRDLSRVQELGQIETLAEILKVQTGQLVNYSTLANQIQVSVDTVKRWIHTLETLHYCFVVRPWFKNVPKSLRKEPKVYLWDWSQVTEEGAKQENLVASHLLKSVHFWNDSGLGDYGLYFLRDKNKREVDFVVVKNTRPWILVEVKLSEHRPLSPELAHFQKHTEAPHAFQAVFDMKYVGVDCFATNQPKIVPAQTLLSQLV